MPSCSTSPSSPGTSLKVCSGADFIVCHCRLLSSKIFKTAASPGGGSLQEYIFNMDWFLNNPWKVCPVEWGLVSIGFDLWYHTLLKAVDSPGETPALLKEQKSSTIPHLLALFPHSTTWSIPNSHLLWKEENSDAEIERSRCYENPFTH